MKANQQSGFVLHRRSYRESSLLVEIFTRNHGRLTLIAKGCRRKKSQIQGLFLGFKPLLLSWTGKGELPILTSIEQTGFYPQLSASGLSSGYYMNELLLKLLHRHDPHELLYDKYYDSVISLIEGSNPYTVLRVFEKVLLQEIGFGLVLDHDVETGEVVVSGSRYRYFPQKGPVIAKSETPDSISGSTLLALQQEEFESDEVQSEAQKLTRSLIDIQLNGRDLRTRRVVREMKQYEIQTVK